MKSRTASSINHYESTLTDCVIQGHFDYDGMPDAYARQLAWAKFCTLPITQRMKVFTALDLESYLSAVCEGRIEDSIKTLADKLEDYFSDGANSDDWCSIQNDLDRVRSTAVTTKEKLIA